MEACVRSARVESLAAYYLRWWRIRWEGVGKMKWNLGPLGIYRDSGMCVCLLFVSKEGKNGHIFGKKLGNETENGNYSAGCSAL